MADRNTGNPPVTEHRFAGLSARLQEPRPYVLTYKLPWSRWLPIPVRHTWEKVCTWDEALAQQAAMREMGLTDCEVRRGL